MEIKCTPQELKELINNSSVIETTDVDNERVGLTFIANHSEKT